MIIDIGSPPSEFYFNFLIVRTESFFLKIFIVRLAATNQPFILPDQFESTIRIKGRIRSGGFLRIFRVLFILFLAHAGGSNQAGTH